MKPGRELDNQIAEKIFGCPVKKGDPTAEIIFTQWDSCGCEDQAHQIHDHYGPVAGIKNYSDDIAAAFEATKEVSLQAIQISYHSHDEPVSVTLALSDGRQVYADGVSEAHAICLALLKVKEKK